MDFPGCSVVKKLPANIGVSEDVGLIPGSGRSPGGGNGNPLQDSCLKNPMDRGAWWVTVHGVPKSQTRLSIRAIHKPGTACACDVCFCVGGGGRACTHIHSCACTLTLEAGEGTLYFSQFWYMFENFHNHDNSSLKN